MTGSKNVCTLVVAVNTVCIYFYFKLQFSLVNQHKSKKYQKFPKKSLTMYVFENSNSNKVKTSFELLQGK